MRGEFRGEINLLRRDVEIASSFGKVPRSKKRGRFPLISAFKSIKTEFSLNPIVSSLNVYLRFYDKYKIPLVTLE